MEEKEKLVKIKTTAYGSNILTNTTVCGIINAEVIGNELYNDKIYVPT